MYVDFKNVFVKKKVERIMIPNKKHTYMYIICINIVYKLHQV